MLVKFKLGLKFIKNACVFFIKCSCLVNHGCSFFSWIICERVFNFPFVYSGLFLHDVFANVNIISRCITPYSLSSRFLELSENLLVPLCNEFHIK
jgi:hypothetical protein